MYIALFTCIISLILLCCGTKERSCRHANAMLSKNLYFLDFYYKIAFIRLGWLNCTKIVQNCLKPIVRQAKTVFLVHYQTFGAK
jgi:hypothetical protein